MTLAEAISFLRSIGRSVEEADDVYLVNFGKGWDLVRTADELPPYAEEIRASREAGE